jgi:glycosyltransferase involved in cell wall biosynthesis
MRVSVVVPVYNSRRYLRQNLEALADLEENGHEVEVVVVDDGSTDGTPDLVAEYPFRLIRQDNQGPAAARNTGWRNSTGQIVFFTDSDCLPPPGWIHGLLPPFAAADVGAAAGSYEVANPAKLLPRLIQAEIRYRHHRMGEFIRAAGTYNMAVRRLVLEQVGGFDQSYPTASGEDNDLSYRILKAGWRIAFQPECRVGHYHPDRIGKYLRSQFVHGYWRSRLYRRHPEFLSGDDYTRKRDLMDSFLAACAMGLLPLVPCFPVPLGCCLAFVLVLLLAVDAVSAGGIALETRDWRLFPAGAGMFVVRAFVRVAGAGWGLVRMLGRSDSSLGEVKR